MWKRRPPPLTQPANSLSITQLTARCPTTSRVDNTAAINNCFTAAQSQGKIAWIPPGTFYISAINGGLNASGITIEGAGPWYSTIYRVTPANNTQGIANIITTRFLHVAEPVAGLQRQQPRRQQQQRRRQFQRQQLAGGQRLDPARDFLLLVRRRQRHGARIAAR